MDFQTIIDYAKKCVLENYANFNGRARRSEYWSYTLCVFVVSFVLNILARIPKVGGIFSILATVVSLGLLVPGLAVAWRRLHDIGKSGGWYFIGLIPIVGWIILIVWFCQDSQPGDNLYGPNPKGY